MFEGLKNLINSEKAIAAGVLAICATVLCALGQMTVTDWQTYTRDVLIVYIGGKTAQGLGSAIATAIAQPKVETKPKTDAKDADASA